MDSLTPTELNVFNDMSEVLKPSVHLGTVIQGIISNENTEATVSGTPVNAVEATMALAITGTVADGETVTINNPANAGSDVYEFVADTAKSLTAESNIAVDINAVTVKAAVTLTIATRPTSGDTFTIGDKTYIFVPVGTNNAPGEIAIGADVAAARLNIVAAINGTDNVNEPHPSVRAAAFSGTDSVITALVGGAAGNAIVSTETFTAVGNIFSGDTFASGADCSAANAVTALVAAITAHDTQGVGAADGTGDVVDLTADLAGTVGNAIILAESLQNGAFTGGATHLAGGVDGTVAKAGKIMFDETNVYICLADNTAAGKNWKKIAHSSL